MTRSLAAALVVAVPTAAWSAPEASARIVAGGLGVGEAGVVEVLVTTDGVPARGQLDRTDGQPVERIGRGRFRTEITWRGETLTLPATWSTESENSPLPVIVKQAARPPEVDWPERMVGVAGATESLQLPLLWSGQTTIDDIWVAAGAGAVSAMRAEGDSLVVGLDVPEAPFPRAIPMLAVDLAAPGAPASLGTVVLRARTQIPVRTAPGTTVTVEVGSRTLQPVVADEDGRATVSAWIRPGDETARLRLADASGNVNTSTIRLGGDPRPHLVGLATPGQVGERRPSVVVAATTATGRAWSGEAPHCATPDGRPVALVAVGPGTWRGPLVADDLELGSVECHLGLHAQAIIRLPRPTVRPADLKLRVSPPEVDANSPGATIRAWVVDTAGDRLPVAAPTVTVDHGSLSTDPTRSTSGVAVLQYDGTEAISRGGDVVRAAWTTPAGGGPARDLDLRWTRADGQLLVFGRLLDDAGRPLAEAPVVFTLGDISTDGAATDGPWSTGAFDVPSKPTWLSVRGLQSGRAVGAWIVPRTAGTELPSSADLSASEPLRIVTGPVRRVGLQVNPPTLRTLDGQSATIVLELLDRDGNPVTDLPVELDASRGKLTPTRQRGDGRYEATFTPDREGDIGKVEIVARSPDDHFPATATELELVADDIRRAPGLHIGWLAGSDGASSPWVSIDGDIPLEILPERVMLRASAGLYGLRAQASDPSTGQDLSVSADLVPLGVGLLGRLPRGRFVTWAGASVLAVPYRIQVSVDATAGVRGLALAPPGAHAYTGAGLRTRTGEVDFNLGYLFINTNAGDSGWQGSAGGLLTTVGYRHAF